jgi:hypothetical protein
MSRGGRSMRPCVRCETVSCPAVNSLSVQLRLQCCRSCAPSWNSQVWHRRHARQALKTRTSPEARHSRHGSRGDAGTEAARKTRRFLGFLGFCFCPPGRTPRHGTAVAACQCLASRGRTAVIGSQKFSSSTSTTDLQRTRYLFADSIEFARNFRLHAVDDQLKRNPFVCTIPTQTPSSTYQKN